MLRKNKIISKISVISILGILASCSQVPNQSLGNDTSANKNNQTAVTTKNATEATDTQTSSNGVTINNDSESLKDRIIYKNEIVKIIPPEEKKKE